MINDTPTIPVQKKTTMEKKKTKKRRSLYDKIETFPSMIMAMNSS
jgi:hypothetical protein